MPPRSPTDWRAASPRRWDRSSTVRPLSSNAWFVEAGGRTLVAKIGARRPRRGRADCGDWAPSPEALPSPRSCFADDDARRHGGGRPGAAHAGPRRVASAAPWPRCTRRALRALGWRFVVDRHLPRRRLDVAGRRRLLRRPSRASSPHAAGWKTRWTASSPGSPQLLPAGGPALLHGDLWWGNVLFGADGRAWLIDPVGARGPPRGGPRHARPVRQRSPTACWRPTRRCSPLQPGWQERVALFQLYPLLVHAVLFGGGYRVPGRGRRPAGSPDRPAVAGARPRSTI